MRIVGPPAPADGSRLRAMMMDAKKATTPIHVSRVATINRRWLAAHSGSPVRLRFASVAAMGKVRMTIAPQMVCSLLTTAQG